MTKPIKKEEALNRAYFTKTMTVKEVVDYYDLIIKLCNNAKGFNLSWDLASKVIKPLNEKVKVFSEKNTMLVAKYGKENAMGKPEINPSENPKGYNEYTKEVHKILEEKTDILLYKFNLEQDLPKEVLIDNKPITASQIAFFMDMGLL